MKKEWSLKGKKLSYSDSFSIKLIEHPIGSQGDWGIYWDKSIETLRQKLIEDFIEEENKMMDDGKGYHYWSDELIEKIINNRFGVNCEG